MYISQHWTCCPNLSVPRRWCAIGALNAAVYVASGTGHKVDDELSYGGRRKLIVREGERKRGGSWRWRMAGVGRKMAVVINGEVVEEEEEPWVF